MTLLDEERAFLERSLADLDAEHAAGDLSDRDFERLRTSYRARLDRLAPAGAASSAGPAGPVGSAGPGPGAPASDAAAPSLAPAPAAARRRRRRTLGLAAAAVILAAVAGGLLVRSSGQRLPSGVATGSAVGAERTALLLQRAGAASAKGDGVAAARDYGAVLQSDPNQLVALTQEGWIFVQTGQPQLIRDGVGLLSRALTVQPGYPPALVYRGLAELSEDDWGDAVTDLQAYLAGSPDPALVPKVQSALASAKAGLAAASQSSPAAPSTSGAPPAPAG